MATDMESYDFDRLVKNFPVFPTVAMKIVGITEGSFDLSFAELENIIKTDPILSAKILKVANSALYARQKEITNLKMAISLIGFKNIKSLVLLASVSNMFGRYRGNRFYQRFWEHSLNVAFIVKHIALETPLKNLAEQAFLAGLFHDLGQIALFFMAPEEYDKLLERRTRENLRMRTLERERFGFIHTEAGAEILTKWNFPSFFVDAAREHGNENITSSNKPFVAAVTVADILSSEIEGYALTEERMASLSKMSLIADFPRERLDPFRKGLKQALAEDPLYRESRNIF